MRQDEYHAMLEEEYMIDILNKAVEIAAAHKSMMRRLTAKLDILTTKKGSNK